MMFFDKIKTLNLIADLVSNLQRKIRVSQVKAFDEKNLEEHFAQVKVRRPLSAEYRERIASVWLKYGVKDYRCFEFFQAYGGLENPYLVPLTVWRTKMCPVLCRRWEFPKPLLNDKNYLDVVLPDVATLPILVRNVYGQLMDKSFKPLSQKEVVSLCCREQKLVVKPSQDSAGGKNITVLTNTQNADFEKKLLEVMKDMKADYVIQPYFRQHERLAALNPESVNTLRIYSLLWKGEVHILNTIGRIGAAGNYVDNMKTGQSFACNINRDGKFSEVAYTWAAECVKTLPSGVVLKDYEIPAFNKVLDVVRSSHYRLAHFGFIGWDLSVDQAGEPTIIEVNLRYPGGILGQMVSGPIFGEGELFTEVMDKVFRKR